MTRQPCGSDVSGARGKHKSRTPLLRQLQPRLPNGVIGLVLDDARLKASSRSRTHE